MTDRRVWVIERDGEPVACGPAGQAEPLPTPGHTLTHYTPDLTTELRALAALLAATADAAREKAYADSTRPGLRAVFAGRSDGFAVAAEWLLALLAETAAGKAGLAGELLTLSAPGSGVVPR